MSILSTPDPLPNSVPETRLLQAMQIVAKMKEAADRQGIGFVGGFVTDDGKKFTMTNMSNEDTQKLMPENLK